MYQKAVQMLVLAVNQKVKPLLLVRINNKVAVFLIKLSPHYQFELQKGKL